MFYKSIFYLERFGSAPIIIYIYKEISQYITSLNNKKKGSEN